MSAPVLENLADKKILVVTVPEGTTDKLQPLVFMVNKAAKNFSETTSMHTKSRNSIRSRKTSNKVQVNMTTAVMNEFFVQWLVALYDNLRDRLENRFKEAGIVAALENQVDKRSDEDLFADLD